MILALVAQNQVRLGYPAQSWRFVSLGRLAPAYEPSFAPFASRVTDLPGAVAFVQSLITVSAHHLKPLCRLAYRIGSMRYCLLVLDK